MKIRTSVVLFILSIFFLLPLRWFDALGSLGKAVPFTVSHTLFLWVIGAVTIALIFVSLLAKGSRIRVNTRKNGLMGFIMLIVCAALAAESALYFFGYNALASFSGIQAGAYSANIETVRDYIQTMNGITLPNELVARLIMFNGSKSLYYAIACVAAAIGFLMMSVDFFRGRNFFRTKPLLALLPTVWGCVRVVFSFMYYTTVANLTSCMLDILFMAASLIFLFAQARLFSDIEAKKAVKIATAAGLSGILFALCSSGIRYALMFTGQVSSMGINDQPDYLDLVLSLMMFAYIIYITSPRSRRGSSQYEESDIPVQPLRPANAQPISNRPSLFLHDEQPEQKIQKTEPEIISSNDDYYYGDHDSQGRKIVLPQHMQARGALNDNTYVLKRTNRLAPRAYINTRGNVVQDGAYEKSNLTAQRPDEIRNGNQPLELFDFE